MLMLFCLQEFHTCCPSQSFNSHTHNQSHTLPLQHKQEPSPVLFHLKTPNHQQQQQQSSVSVHA